MRMQCSTKTIRGVSGCKLWEMNTDYAQITATYSDEYYYCIATYNSDKYPNTRLTRSPLRHIFCHLVRKLEGKGRSVDDKRWETKN